MMIVIVSTVPSLEYILKICRWLETHPSDNLSRISTKRSKMVKVHKTHISKNISNSGHPEFYAESKNEV